MDATLVAALVWLLGQRAALAPRALAVALLVAAASIVWRWGQGAGVRRLGLVLFLLATGHTAWAARGFERRETALRHVIHGLQRCEATARVDGSPKRRGEAFVWTASLSSVSCEDGARPGELRARLFADSSPARGDVLSVLVQLGALEHFDDPALPSPITLLAPRDVVASGSVVHAELIRPGRGVTAVIDRARSAIRRRIEASYPPSTSALARALVLGEEDLTAEDQAAFRRSGLAHLLAVSGSHLVVAVLGVTAVLRSIFARIEAIAGRVDAGSAAAAIGGVLAFAYADLAGGSGSAWRAAVMLGAVSAARVAGARPRAERALGLSMMAMALCDPFVAYDLSFVLSAAATLGLLVGAGSVAARLSLPLGAGRALGASLCATAATAPILALSGASVSVVGLGVNLVAAPLGELFALPFCLLSAATPWLSAIERGAALIGSGALAGVAFLARASAAPSWAAWSLPPLTTPQVTGLLLAGSAALVTRRARLAAAGGVALLVAGEVAAASAGRPAGKLRVTFFDVGQGDAALVDLPDRSAILVDGGGLVGSPVDVGARVIVPELAARRRRQLELAVLSHPHPDHFLGLATVAASVPVHELWDTGQGEERPAEAWSRLVASVPRIVRPAGFCGARTRGGAKIEVFAPCPSFDGDLGPNDNSIVMRISLGARSVLLVGDAEHHEEAKLLASRADLHADVLKLGHHGSRTSSGSAFLAAVGPTWTVASTGVRNRFGHPHAETLGTLRRLGLPLARTDLHGAVVWETDGVEARLWSRRPL